MNFVLLFILWISYFGIHSLLASLWLKKWAYEYISETRYRLLFNAIALITLLPLLYFSLFIPDKEIVTFHFLKYLGFVLILISFGILFKAFSSFNMKVFMGFAPEPVEASLHFDGMYKYVRHPLYFGVIILLLGLLCVLPSAKILVLCIISFGYLLIGSYLEEQKLILQFGEEYKAYQKRVKALIPFIF